MDMTSLQGWLPYLEDEIRKPYFKDLQNKVTAAYAVGELKLFPPEQNLFRALELTPPGSVHCIIVGQDPYHQAGQANGLAFSVDPGCKLPPSLRNIFKELQDDTGCSMPSSGDLTHWAKQGVLLLNTSLTVEEGKAGSCSDWGWDRFTSEVLRICESLPQPIIYILWGSHAQKIGANLRRTPNRLVISSAHPSPLSAYRGFFGSKPFSKANNWLVANGCEPIKW